MRTPLLIGSLSVIIVGVATASAENASSAEYRRLHDEYLATCMKDWDAQTQMTKEEWGRTCRRLAQERSKFRVEHSKEIPLDENQ